MQRLQQAIDENQRSITVMQQRRQEAERHSLNYVPAAMYDQEKRLRQREKDFEQAKMARLSEWGLGVGLVSMVSGGVSTAISAAPIIAHAAPFLALTACNIM
jgi:hypothetical protein